MSLLEYIVFFIDMMDTKLMTRLIWKKNTVTEPSQMERWIMPISVEVYYTFSATPNCVISVGFQSHPIKRLTLSRNIKSRNAETESDTRSLCWEIQIILHVLINNFVYIIMQ